MNFVRVLAVLRALIAYTKDLAEAIQRPELVKKRVLEFHTINLGNILDRIARALERALALEIRLVKLSERRVHAPAAAPDVPKVQATKRRDRSHRVRLRPVGEELADICRELRMRPDNKLWRELMFVIITTRGNFTRLVKDTLAWMLSPLPLAELFENPEGFEAHMPPPKNLEMLLRPP